jgi:hypothetical protein
VRDARESARSARLLAPVLSKLRRFEEEPDVPVFAGPWLGEVGFELLYWIPFLRWAVSEFPGLRCRLAIQSRGGVTSWYEGLPAHYVDLFDHVNLKEFRERFGQFFKQTESYDGYTDAPGMRNYSDAEQEIVELVRREVGVSRLNVLHPRVMYGAFKHIQRSRGQEFAKYFPQLTPPSVSGLELPERFIAVRFYGCFPLPASDTNQAFVRELVTHLADELPIVCLNTGMSIDRKHPDFPLEAIDSVIQARESMTLANNLAVQSAIIGQADAFVGSYGGLSYLPPLFGRPSFSLYSDGRSLSKTSHLHLARSMLARPRLGGYWVGSVEEKTPRAVADVVLAS